MEEKPTSWSIQVVDTIVQHLVAQPEAARLSYLEKLKRTNPTLHAQVGSKMMRLGQA